MRNPKRMKPFLDEVEKIWADKFPDWRFGQLIFNFISAYGDPFHLEEDEFLVALKAYTNNEDPSDAILEHLRKKCEEEAEKRKKERIKEEWNYTGNGNLCRRRLEDKIKYFGGKDPE